MLEAVDVSFRYAPTTPWVLRDLNLRVAPGEIVGLPGPSGRGKTTLAKIIGGFLAPSRGTVRLDGRPLPEEGFCSIQLLSQHPELAVDPRWKAGAIINEGYHPDGRQLTAFDVQPAWLTRYPCELSGGQLARICLVRALGPAVRYLIADEITTMLDALTQARIWKALIRYTKQRGIGMLVISHDSTLLERLCHRISDIFID